MASVATQTDELCTCFAGIVTNEGDFSNFFTYQTLDNKTDIYSIDIFYRDQKNNKHCNSNGRRKWRGENFH